MATDYWNKAKEGVYVTLVIGSTCGVLWARLKCYIPKPRRQP